MATILKKENSKDELYTRFNLYNEEKNEEITSIVAGYYDYISDKTKIKLIEATPYANVKPMIYISCFGTAIEYRHKGYGRKMLQEIKNYFDNCILWLHVFSTGEMTNDELIKFYKSEGFNELMIDDSLPGNYQIMYTEL